MINISAYLIAKYSLYRATILALSLPFLIFVIAGLKTYYLYGYELPFTYYLYSLLPLLCIFLKVSITEKQHSVIVKWYILGIRIVSSSYSKKSQDDLIQWVAFGKSKRLENTTTGVKYPVVFDAD